MELIAKGNSREDVEMKRNSCSVVSPCSPGSSIHSVTVDEYSTQVLAKRQSLVVSSKDHIVASLTYILSCKLHSAVFPDQIPSANHIASMFYSVSTQTFSMNWYVNRIVTYINCSPSVFTVALTYFSKVRDAEHTLDLNELNVHRLLLTAVSIACKFTEDSAYSNEFIARVGGIQRLDEMNRMEAAFLRLIKFECFPDHEVYEHYRKLMRLP
mmetsp:Transcript_3297/g.5784  ORF Transcript_3297/g.5784 Transcript_3297/m.5784 type:complete len:212 (+) Transcript_3297:115-750(+)